jgi:hypothetical protein
LKEILPSTEDVDDDEHLEDDDSDDEVPPTQASQPKTSKKTGKLASKHSTALIVDIGSNSRSSSPSISQASNTKESFNEEVLLSWKTSFASTIAEEYSYDPNGNEQFR